MSSISFSRPRGEEGQGLMEFALVLLLVAIVVLVIVTIFGTQLHTMYCSVTHQVAPQADLSSTCSVPVVMPRRLDQGPNHLNLEAAIYDPDGDQTNPYAQIEHVEFYIDNTNGTPVIADDLYHFCLGGGDSGCNSYDISGLTPGTHTVIILAYDSDGNVGRANHRFEK